MFRAFGPGGCVSCGGHAPRLNPSSAQQTVCGARDRSRVGGVQGGALTPVLAFWLLPVFKCGLLLALLSGITPGGATPTRRTLCARAVSPGLLLPVSTASVLAPHLIWAASGHCVPACLGPFSRPVFLSVSATGLAGHSLSPPPCLLLLSLSSPSSPHPQSRCKPGRSDVFASLGMWRRFLHPEARCRVQSTGL